MSPKAYPHPVPASCASKGLCSYERLTKLHLRKRYELMRYVIQKGLERLPE